MKHPAPLVIGIAGGSGSGKTTVAQADPATGSVRIGSPTSNTTPTTKT
ncbi:MAG: hypothetical protein MZV70_21260 [Desulfobacterales bacterium]|nr:hypothetical protein [Desulfobacterales bacterium]